MSRPIVESSDPRLSGTWTVTETWHARCIQGTPTECEDGEHLIAGTVHVENDGGTWLGRREGYESALHRYDQTVLSGQGDYAGLTAVPDYAQNGLTGAKGVAGDGVIAGEAVPVAE